VKPEVEDILSVGCQLHAPSLGQMNHVFPKKTTKGEDETTAYLIEV
jgi:hypothetical protein